MVATILDVVKIDVVLVGYRLLRTLEEVNDFRLAIETDVQIAGAGLVTNAPLGVTEPTYTLVLNRDRIALEISSLRSTISRDYPSREDIARLADVAGQAISSTSDSDYTPRAFGFNIELVFDQDDGISAFRYIGDRLFNIDIWNDGWQISGGSGRMIFVDSNEKRWTVAIEPRFNDENSSRVFLSLNLHQDKQCVPAQEEMEDSLREIWDQAHKFVRWLDKGS